MVPERMNGNEDQVATAAANIITIEHLQYWAHHNLQELLNEINRICQYHDNTVTSHNELIDQLQASVKGVETLKQELWDLGNDHEKQTDDLLQTQSQLDQAWRQIWVLKADNAAKTTRLQALENETETPRLLSVRQDSPANSNNTLSSNNWMNKSLKLSDSPVFTDEKNLTWEVWETKIQNKLKVNADYYSTALSQIAYIVSHVKGDAAEHIHARRRDGATKSYTSINELLEYLASIYEDQDIKLTAQNTYKNLWMRITESFMTFYSKFAQITSVLLYDEHTLMDDLKNRLIRCLQNSLALCEAEFEDIISLKAYLQWTDKAQHSLYLQRQNNQKESPFNISRFKDSTNTSWSITFTRLTLAAVPAVPVTRLNFFLRIITNTTAAEREQLWAQGKCFLCKQVEHISDTCLNNKEAQDLNAARIQELDTTELSKNK